MYKKATRLEILLHLDNYKGGFADCGKRRITRPQKNVRALHTITSAVAVGAAAASAAALLTPLGTAAKRKWVFLCLRRYLP